MSRTLKLQEQQSRDVKNTQTSCNEFITQLHCFRITRSSVAPRSEFMNCRLMNIVQHIFHPNVSSLKHHVHKDRIVHTCVIYHILHLPIRAMGRKLHFNLVDKRDDTDDEESCSSSILIQGALTVVRGAW